MTDTTVWNGSIPAGTSATTTLTRTDSLVFKVTEGVLSGIAFYVPAIEDDVAGSDYTAILYSTVTGLTGTEIASEVGSGTFEKDAWNWIPLPDVELVPGTWYSAAIISPNTLQYLHNYWGAGNPGAGGITVGPIIVPDPSVAPGNGTQGEQPGTGYPATFNNSWYGIDIKVTVTDSDAATGSVTLPKMSLSGSSTEHSVGSGSVTIPKMSLSGSSTERSIGSGAVKLPKMSLSASSAEHSAGTGNIALPKMTISGNSAEKSVGSALVTIPKMRVQASDTRLVRVSPMFIFSQL